MSKTVTPPEPRPAATVVLLRDTPAGMETLLLRRNQALAWAGGYWVFPGGAIDPADLELAAGDIDEAARHAAVREAHEEAGVLVDTELVLIGNWISPAGESRRFATWHYLAHCDANAEIIVDGSEIVEARWLSIAATLGGHRAGHFRFYPPTWFTLLQLREFERVDTALAVLGGLEPVHVLPVFGTVDGAEIAMFEGDAGYHSGEAEHDGPRHRVRPDGKQWIYEYGDVAAGIRPLDGRELIER